MLQAVLIAFLFPVTVADAFYMTSLVSHLSISGTTFTDELTFFVEALVGGFSTMGLAWAIDWKPKSARNEV